jgi:hypothetical protein
MSPTRWSPRIGSSHAPGYRNGRAILGHPSAQDLHCVARLQGNDEPSIRSDGLDTHTYKQKNTYQTGHALGCRQHLRSDRIRKSRSREFKKPRIREAAIRKLLPAKAGGELLAAPWGLPETPVRHFKRGSMSQNVREERRPITSAFRNASELPGRMTHCRSGCSCQ